MFINYTNHPSVRWSEEQSAAANEYGIIHDLCFPQVNPELSEEELEILAEEELRKIQRLQPKAVLCQGEFTLCYRVIRRLLAEGIPVMAACSARIVREQTEEDGTTRKVTEFRFVKFRRYQ